MTRNKNNLKLVSWSSVLYTGLPLPSQKQTATKKKWFFILSIPKLHIHTWLFPSMISFSLFRAVRSWTAVRGSWLPRGVSDFRRPSGKKCTENMSDLQNVRKQPSACKSESSHRSCLLSLQSVSFTSFKTMVTYQLMIWCEPWSKEQNNHSYCKSVIRVVLIMKLKIMNL